MRFVTQPLCRNTIVSTGSFCGDSNNEVLPNGMERMPIWHILNEAASSDADK